MNNGKTLVLQEKATFPLLVLPNLKTVSRIKTENKLLFIMNTRFIEFNSFGPLPVNKLCGLPTWRMCYQPVINYYCYLKE